MKTPALIRKLRIARHALTLIRDTSRTEHAFGIVDEMSRLPRLAAKFPFTPEMERYLKDPFSQGFPDLARLRAMPAHTFGHAVALHMDQLGTDFSEFERSYDLGERMALIDRHFFETHDLWHVLTGFGPGTANELGLQAFTLAQLKWIPSLSLLSLAMVRVFMAGGQEINPCFDVLALGWSRGRAASPMFGVDWRPYFDRPLAAVRAEFGVDPVQQAEIAEVPARLVA